MLHATQAYGWRDRREEGRVIMAETEKVGEELGHDHLPVVCRKETVRGSPVARCSQCSLVYATVW